MARSSKSTHTKWYFLPFAFLKAKAPSRKQKQRIVDSAVPLLKNLVPEGCDSQEQVEKLNESIDAQMHTSLAESTVDLESQNTIIQTQNTNTQSTSANTQSTSTTQSTRGRTSSISSRAALIASGTPNEQKTLPYVSLLDKSKFCRGVAANVLHSLLAISAFQKNRPKTPGKEAAPQPASSTSQLAAEVTESTSTPSLVSDTPTVEANSEETNSTPSVGNNVSSPTSEEDLHFSVDSTPPKHIPTVKAEAKPAKVDTKLSKKGTKPGTVKRPVYKKSPAK